MPVLDAPRRTFQSRTAPRLAGTVGLLGLAALLALMLGYVCAVFPLSFSSKLAVLVLGAVVVVWAFAAAQGTRERSVGNAARISINLFAFLSGACPVYLPFKFGPLPGLNPVRIVFGAILITGLYAIITSRELRASIAATVAHSKWAFGFVLSFLLWELFCAFVGDQPVFSIYYLIKVLLPAFVMFIFAMAFYRDWRDIQRTAVYLLLGALVACVAGLVEWRTRSNVFLRFFPSDPGENSGLDWILYDKSRGGDYRVSATFAHPLVLAEFLCMTLPLTLMLAVRAVEFRNRLLAWVALPVLAVMIYLSYTRSSLIAAVTSLVVIALVFGIRFGADRKRPGLAMLGWMTVVAAVWVAAGLSGSAAYLAKGRTEAEAGSSQARVYMLKRAQTVLAEQPVQGYGPGLGAIKIGRIPGQRGLTIDSYFLSVAIESGYLGLALFGLAMGAVLRRTLAAGIRVSGVESWTLIALGTAILASLIVKIVLSLTDNMELLYLLIGLALVGVKLAAPAIRAARSTSERPVPSSVHVPLLR